LDIKHDSGKNLSRRTFLKGLPLGFFALATVGVIGTNLLKSVRRRRSPVFKKGSIFTPRSPQ